MADKPEGRKIHIFDSTCLIDGKKAVVEIRLAGPDDSPKFIGTVPGVSNIKAEGTDILAVHDDCFGKLALITGTVWKDVLYVVFEPSDLFGYEAGLNVIRYQVGRSGGNECYRTVRRTKDSNDVVLGDVVLGDVRIGSLREGVFKKRETGRDDDKVVYCLLDYTPERHAALHKAVGDLRKLLFDMKQKMGKRVADALVADGAEVLLAIVASGLAAWLTEQSDEPVLGQRVDYADDI